MSRLVIDNVSREFPPVSGNTPMRALQPINITVADNDFVTILGPSGCGKSTLLRIVAGLDSPTTGAFCSTIVPSPGLVRIGEWCFNPTRCFPG